MRSLVITTTTVMLLALTAAHAEPQSAKPSTAEDRAKAVEFARSLESDPLGKQAKEQRKWLMLWLIEVPDISVKLCGSLLGPLSGDKNYAAELTTQMAASGVAFMIASPTKASDNVAVYTAGVEGTPRAYESILKVKPKANWQLLDELIEKRSKGELSEYVRQAAARCK